MSYGLKKAKYLQDNRRRFFDLLDKDAFCVLFSGMPVRKSADLFYPFAGDRNFYYLTGIEQEGSVLLIVKEAGLVKKLKLFVKFNDDNTVRWNGRSLSREAAARVSGIHNVDFSQNLDADIRDYLDHEGFCGKFYMDFDKKNLSNYWLENFVDKSKCKIEKEDTTPIFSKLRAVKSDYEIENIRKAIQITGRAIHAIFENFRPGMMEYQIRAIFEHSLAMQGAGEPSFDTIVATGSNFNYLHYPQLSDEIKEDHLVLLDLGGRWEGMCADISRVFPASGFFTEKQKKLYAAVRACQETAFAAIKPGAYIREVNKQCKDTAREHLREMGLIHKDDDVDKYYWHNVSHHMGLDVHDIVGRDKRLEAGMIVSVEPGIYILEWDMGFRIEDDVLVTETGSENLSAEIPREAEEIEALVQKGKYFRG